MVEKTQKVSEALYVDKWGGVIEAKFEENRSDSSSGDDTVPDEYKELVQNDLEQSMIRKSERKSVRKQLKTEL